MLASHEQRQYERLEPSQGSAFVVFRPEFSKIGPINDISRGGLGFNYLHPAENEVPAAETSHRIDIIISKNGFHLTDIPCSLVYDAKADKDQMTLMPDLVNRLCGLKFGSLTEEQEKQINHFLENHTVGSA
jgi:hypothetical protein